MNFIWFKSCEIGTDLPRNLHDVVAVESGKDSIRLINQRPCRGIVIEVRNAEDSRRALQLVEDSHGAYPVWIYQPSATVESTVAFMKAGASQVSTTRLEVDRAMNRAREFAVRDADTHRAMIGASASIQTVSSSIELVASRRCNVLIEGKRARVKK